MESKVALAFILVSRLMTLNDIESPHSSSHELFKAIRHCKCSSR